MATPTAFKQCAVCRQDNNALVAALIGSDNYVYIGQSQIENQTQANTWTSLVNTAVGAQAIGAALGSDNLVRISVLSNTNSKLGMITQATINGASWTNTNLAGTPTGVAGGLESDYRDDRLVVFGIISNTGGNTTQGNFAIAVQAGVTSSALGAATTIYGT